MSVKQKSDTRYQLKSKRDFVAHEKYFFMIKQYALLMIKQKTNIKELFALDLHALILLSH